MIINSKKYYVLYGAIAFGVLLLLSGCAKKEEAVLAKVDDTIVTVGEFTEMIKRVPSQYRALVEREKKRFLDDYVVELLISTEAIRQGMDKEEDTRQALREARRKILMAKYVEEEIEKKISVKEEEMLDFYEKNSGDFMVPETWRASHILVKTEEEITELLTALSEGADFGELAKEKSIDLTNRRGGDIGYFQKGQLVPEFEEACGKLGIGEISPAVKTSFGYHVIKLTDKKPSSVKPFDSVKDQIRNKLLNQRRKERFDHTVEKLKNRATIEINYDLLAEGDVSTDE